MKKTLRRVGVIGLILLPACLNASPRTTEAAPQAPPQAPAAEWQAYDVGFHPVNVSSAGNAIWVCGSDETIAVSSDNGLHWQVKHHKPGGPSLSIINFANPQFGYAAGAHGALLITENGGDTWTGRPGLKDTVMQVAFADSLYGLVRVPKALLFTVDGGSHWSKLNGVNVPKSANEFPYTFSLVSLDEAHMAVMLKKGPAQYESQAFLFTEDSGKTWKFLNIPNVTLYSFLAAKGRYWAVGTEVIHKQDPGGGYAVPVALYSTNGDSWSRFAGDLSSCKLEMCTACTAQGCLSSNGVVTRIFSETGLAAFPPNKDLTTKWAPTDSLVCFVDTRLHCAGLSTVSKPPTKGGPPVPYVLTPEEPLHFSGSR